MKPFFGISGLSASILLIFTACGCSGSSDSNDLPIENGPTSIQLDPRLSPDEKSLVAHDLDTIRTYDIEAEPGSNFDKAFQGTSTAGVSQYLNTRVSYIIPASVNPEDQLVRLNSMERVGEQTAPSISPGLGRVADSQVYVVALNIGTLVWFNALLALPEKLGFMIGDRAVPITSSRLGIVQLGKGYTVKKGNEYAFPPLARIATLVHEARHSDCTGGLAQADLEKLRAQDIPDGHGCGHLHVVCPPGHPYAGIYACDDLAWGAYSIEAIYAAAILKHCQNCTVEDQGIAEGVEVDSLSRLILPVDDMLNGKLGDPDMSSGGLL
jgi:hypothetical protein